MKNIFNNIQKLNYILALLGGFVAGVNSLQNNERSHDICGEYASSLVIHGNDALIFAVPTIILFVLIAISYDSKSAKFVSFLVAASYFSFATYEFLNNIITNYGICDRKGDESTMFLIMVSFVGIPVLWIFLLVILEISVLIFRVLKKLVTLVVRGL